MDVNCGLGTEGIAAARCVQQTTALDPAPSSADATASFLLRNDSLAVLDRPNNVTQVEEVSRCRDGNGYIPVG